MRALRAESTWRGSQSPSGRLLAVHTERSAARPLLDRTFPTLARNDTVNKNAYSPALTGTSPPLAPAAGMSGEETPEARFARLLPPNATVVDHFVLTVLLDPWTYLGYLMMLLTPLVLVSAWASWVLVRDVGREKREKRAKRKSEKEKKARAKAWADWRDARKKGHAE